MKKHRARVGFTAALAFVLILSACGKKDAAFAPEPETAAPAALASAAPSETAAPTAPPPSETPDISGLAINPLTGLYVNEEIAKRRPIAVVINNIAKALPQSGIGQADMYYEVLAEGDITRIIALFQDFNAEKIGPVRSARHYFMYFAAENNAIFAHYGASNEGFLFVKQHKVENLEGLFSDVPAFWRDKARMNTPGMYEHSAYTDAKSLLDRAASKYDMTRSESYPPLFEFYDEFTVPEGSAVTTIKLPFSKAMDSTFLYDEAIGKYLKFEFGKPHTDVEDGGQIAVDNVIVQFAAISSQNDAYNHIDVELSGKGTGLLFTAGKREEITWSRSGYDAQTRYASANGERIRVNKGKTYINVLSKASTVGME